MNQLTVMLNNNNNNTAATSTNANSNAANNNGNHGQQQQGQTQQQQQYFTFGHGQTIQAIQQQGPGMAIQTDPNQPAQLVTYHQQQPQPQQGTTIMVGTQAYTTATQPSINQSQQQQPGAIQYFIAPTTFPQQQQQCQPAQQQQLLTTQTTQQPFGLMSNLITPGVSMFPLQPQQQTNGTIQLQQSPQLITQNGTTLQQPQQPTFLAMTTNNQSTGTIQIAAGANGNNGATGGQLFTQQHLPMGQQQQQQPQQQFHIIGGSGANQSAIQINQNPLQHHQQQHQLNPQIITNAAGQQFILNPGLQQQIVNTPAMMSGTSHLIATNVLNQQQQQPQSHQQQQQQQIYQIVLPNGQVIQTVQPTISNGTNNAAAATTLISPQQIQFQPQTQHLQQPQQQLQSHHHLLQTQQLTVPIQQQQQQLHQPTFLGPALTLQQSTGQPTFIQHQPQQQQQQQHLVQIGQQHQLIANCNTSNVQYANAGTVRDNTNNYQLANLTGTLQQQQPQTHQLNSPTLILTTTGPAAISPSVQNQSILIQTQNTGSSSNLLIPARSMSNSTSGSSSSQSSNSNHQSSNTANNNSSTTTAMVVLTQSPIAPQPPTCVNSSAASSAATTANTGTQSTNGASLLPNSVLDHKSIQPIVTNNKQATEVVVPTAKRSNVNNTNNSNKKKTIQLSSQQNQSAAFTTEMVNNSSSSSLTLTTTKLVENLSENVQKLTNSFRPPSVGENLDDSANRNCTVVTNPKLISECLKNKTASVASETTTKQATTTTTIATMTDGDISKFQNAIDEASKTQIEFSEKISTSPPSPSPSCCSSTGSLRIAIDDEDGDDDDDDEDDEDENEEADNGERDDTEEGSNDKQDSEGMQQCDQQTTTIDNTIDCEENTTENDECSTETEIDNDTVNNQTEEEEEQEQVEEINSNEMDVVDDSGEDLQTQQQSEFDFNKPNELSVVNSFEQPKQQQQQLNPLVPTPEDKEGYQSSYGGSPCHFTDTEDEEEEEEDEDEEAEVADNLDNGNEIKLVRGKNGLTKAAYNLINNRILGSEDDNATNASIDSSSKNSLISSINEELCLINNAESINDEEDNGSTLDDQNQTNISKIHPSATPSPAASIASSNGIMEPESTTQNLLVSSTKVSNLIEKTINNTTDVRIIDGVNLDEIKDFAKAFKLCRLSLGLTQSQVGHELSALNGPCYSQSAICRFEKLDITPKSAKKIKPVLENWMRDAEKKHRISKLAVCSGSVEMNDSNNNTNEFNDTNSPMATAAKDSNQNEAFFKMNSLDFVMNSLNSSKSLSSEIISSLNISLDPGKKRKRRTSFSHATIDALNNFFEKNQHPTSSEMTQISEILNQDRDVVRVWFCNKRQALRAKKPNNGQSTNSGDISGGDLSQDSNQSQNEYPSTSTALTVQILNNHSNGRLGPVLSQVSSFSSTTATNTSLPPKLDNLSHHQTAASIHSQPNHPHFPSLSSSLHHHAGTITFPSYQPTSTIPLSLSSSSSSSAPVATKMVKFSQPNFATATKSSTQRSPNLGNNQSSSQSSTQSTTTNNTTSIRLYPTVSVTHHGTTPNSQPPNHHQQLHHRIPNGGGILSHSHHPQQPQQQQPQLANFNQYGKNMTTNSTKHKIVKTELLNHANNKSEVNNTTASAANTGNLLAK